jgi:hypothetical protein
MTEDNQGAGQLPGAGLQLAEAAMEVFCQDLRRAGTSVATFSRDPSGDDGVGRFGFSILLADGTVHQIQMLAPWPCRPHRAPARPTPPRRSVPPPPSRNPPGGPRPRGRRRPDQD